MQSFGLALTLSLLTGTLVALDLSDWQGESSRVAAPQTSFDAVPDDRANALSIMPSGLPGVAVPRADINNGIFAIGSSTGKEQPEVDGDAMKPQDSTLDDEADAPNTDTEAVTDFVLV